MKKAKKKIDGDKAHRSASKEERAAIAQVVRLIAAKLFEESKEYGDPREWDDEGIKNFSDDFRHDTHGADEALVALAQSLAKHEWAFAMLAQENLQKAIDEAYEGHGDKYNESKFQAALNELETAAQRVVEMATASKPDLDIAGDWFNWISPPTK